MKLKALLRVALIGAILSLLSAQDTYSELDAEIIKEFLAELDEQIEDVLEDQLASKKPTKDLESLLQNEKEEIALENALEDQLEEFAGALQDDTYARVSVNTNPVIEEEAQVDPIQASNDSKELVEMENNLEELKQELSQLTKENEQKELDVAELETSQLVKERNDIVQSFAEPVGIQPEPFNIAQESGPSIEQINSEQDAEIRRLTKVAEEAADLAISSQY